MELTKNRYYKFTAPNCKFWYRKNIYPYDKIGKFECDSFDLTDAHYLKFNKKTDVSGQESFWFEHELKKYGTVTGQIGCLNDGSVADFTDLLLPIYIRDIIPDWLMQGIDEINDALNNSKSKRFYKAFWTYQMGAKPISLGLQTKLNSIDAGVPEFLFEMKIENDELTIQIHHHDVGAGDQERVELTFSLSADTILRGDWVLCKDLLVERIKEYKFDLTTKVKCT